MPNPSTTLTPQFFDIDAAVDNLANGAIWLPEYATDILDLVRRRGVFGQRLRHVPATGQPSRYFEQTGIAGGAFVAPGNLTTVVATGPTRVERSQSLTAVAGQINFGLFDVEVTAQQGVFTQLVAKDLKDMVEGCLLVEDKAFWNGNTSNNALSFNGVLNSGVTTGSIAPGVSIVDAIRTTVAQMVNNQTFDVRPTAIYLNAVALDFLEQEMKANTQLIAGTIDVIPGVTAPAIRTAAGNLPLIVEWAMPQLTGGPTGVQYPISIISENLLEYHYVTSAIPRVFQLGLINDLASKFMAVKFGALVVKAATYGHQVLNLQR